MTNSSNMTHAVKKLTKTAALTKNGTSLNGTLLISPPLFVPNVHARVLLAGRLYGDVRRPAFGHRVYSPRPLGYCFSHSRPLNCTMLSSSTVPESRHRALTLKPSGCERGT